MLLYSEESLNFSSLKVWCLFACSELLGRLGGIQKKVFIVTPQRITGADPGRRTGGGGGGTGGQDPPPPFGGPPNFIKRVKRLCVCKRKRSVLVLKDRHR